MSKAVVRTTQDFRGNTMTPTPGSSHESDSPKDVERAHRACEKCTRTKKKCDKALPSCSRCLRLTTACCYDFVYTAPATAVVEPGSLANFMSGTKGGDGCSVTPAYNQSIFDPNFEISSAIIMALLNSRSIDWRGSTDLYFKTINPWFSVIHPEYFAIKADRLGSNGLPRDPEVALLIVCMQLITQYGDAGVPVMPAGKEMIQMPAYVAAKRILGLLRGFSTPGIELIQCGVLLGLYEFGHGDVLRAYVTVGDANSMAKALAIEPGKYVHEESNANITFEDEERRCVYWALLVVDRFIHVDSDLTSRPLHVATPEADDLLPTCNIIWDEKAQKTTKSVERRPANTSPSVPLGPFQRNCQCAMLYTVALELEIGKHGPVGSMNTLSELDVSTRALVEAMAWQSSRWGDFYECFATCTCLLLLLYCRYLRSVDHSAIDPRTNDVEMLKAIAGLNFAVRIITDTTTDLNEQLSRYPNLLASSSPVTPYSAFYCLMVLSTFEQIIPDADERFHAIYSSLHFFAKRWGVAGRLVNRIETFLVESVGISPQDKALHMFGATSIS